MIKDKLIDLLDNNNLIGNYKYIKASVAIPILIINNEEQILFEKRAANIRQGGEVSLPGGECNSDENDSAITAIRETSEELGITNDKINYIGKYGFLLSSFGALIDVHILELKILNLNELNLDSNEVQSVFTLPIKFFIENEPDIYYLKTQIIPNYFDKNGNLIELFPASKLNLPEKYSKAWNINKHRILVYKTKPEIVWGITAEIIYDFINKLKKLI